MNEEDRCPVKHGVSSKEGQSLQRKLRIRLGEQDKVRGSLGSSLTNECQCHLVDDLGEDCWSKGPTVRGAGLTREWRGEPGLGFIVPFLPCRVYVFKGDMVLKVTCLCSEPEHRKQ